MPIREQTTHPSIAIIGAGFSGICAAIQLQEKLQINAYTVYEARSDVGGTWLANTYPGCQCDVPSHLYSLSFAQKPDWKQKYGDQKEILEYLRDVTTKYNIYPRIKFNKELRKAEWNRTTNRWRLFIHDKISGVEEETSVQFLIIGKGLLVQPQVPAQFKNIGIPTIHTAQWPEKDDLDGKNVAIIGTGASAIQAIPKIAPRVNKLYVYQRSAPWVMPKADSHSLVKWFCKKSSIFQTAHRWYYWAVGELLFVALKRGVMYDVVPKMLSAVATRYIHQQITDPSLRKMVTPNYEIGCKRILFSSDYYPAIRSPNVEVITDSISEAKNGKITTVSGEDRQVDVLILATGFQLGDWISPIEVIGANGVSLSEKWKGVPKSYLGLCCDGFPNLFFIYGPQTSLGHSSIIFQIECQVHYVVEMLREVITQDYVTVNVKESAVERVDAKLQQDLTKTVWATSCQSWYKNEEGKVTTNWGGNCLDYWNCTKKPNFEDYHFQSSANGAGN